MRDQIWVSQENRERGRENFIVLQLLRFFVIFCFSLFENPLLFFWPMLHHHIIKHKVIKKKKPFYKKWKAGPFSVWMLSSRRPWKTVDFFHFSKRGMFPGIQFPKARIPPI